MKIALLAGSAAVGLVALAAQDSSVQASQQAQEIAEPRAVADRYCVTCHNPRTSAGQLDLTSVDFARPGEHAAVFEKVIAKLRAGLMPPAGQRQPHSDERTNLVTYLETHLDAAAEAAPNPGRTATFHRLNRAEYENAIRDLLGVEIDVVSLLPADNASFGFDNIGGVLKVSASRLEQYLVAARRIARAAVGTPLPTPSSEEYRVPETTNQYERIEELPFGTRGGMQVRHRFPRTGEYEIAIALLCRLHGECDGSAGFPDMHQLLVLVDGAEVRSFTLEPRSHRELRPPAGTGLAGATPASRGAA